MNDAPPVAGEPPPRGGGGATPLLIGGAVAAFALFLLALAFPPDMGPVDGGAHALSRSPVGYAGVARLFREAGGASVVSRTGDLPAGARGDALLVLTPRVTTSAAEVMALARGRRVLVVPPKWLVVADPRRGGRLARLGVTDPHATLSLADAVLGASSEGAPTALVTTARMGPALAPSSPDENMPRTSPLPLIQRLRTFTGPNMTPVLVDGRGQVLVARARGRPVYVLSDPDLLNNHAVADLHAARAAVGLLAGLADGAPVVWDVTLDGISAGAPAKNPLRVLFMPPFLPATLCLFVAAALTGLAARGRFGAVEAEGRAYAFGKRALADSTASLIALAGREPRFAPRYAEMARGEAVAAMGLTRLGPDAQDAALDRIGEARGVGGWSQLREAARSVAGVRGLLVSARRTWTWRREMTRGRG